MNFFNKVIFWAILATALLVFNTILYEILDSTYAYVVYGDSESIASFRNQSTTEQPLISNSSFGPNELLSILISFEIAFFLTAFGSPLFRKFRSFFSHPAAEADLNALCIGVGGIGKTTLIRKYYGKSEEGVKKTTRFNHVKFQQPVNNISHTISLFDFVGQDFPSLSPEVNFLSSKGINMNLLIIILGLHVVKKNKTTGEYVVSKPSSSTEEGEMFSEMIEKQKTQIFSKATLEMIVNNLPKLENIIVIFNQADLLIPIENEAMTVDCKKLHRDFKCYFKDIMSEIESAAETHRKTYNSLLPVEYRVASILNGIEFVDNSKACIKPITVIEDKIRSRNNRND